MTHEDDLVVEKIVRADPATVFRYFTDTKRWLEWQGTDGTIEARPGGVFRMNVRGDGFAVGEFVELVPDRRVVFTWGWENPDNGVSPGSTTVQIDLSPHDDGTIVRLTHRGLPPPAMDAHRGGWEHYADRLAMVAEGRAPGRDRMRL